MLIGALANRSFRHWSLLPAVLLFVALTLYPLVNLVRMSVSTIEFAQGAERFGDRDLGIDAMQRIQVDPHQAEPAQAHLALLAQIHALRARRPHNWPSAQGAALWGHHACLG